MVQKANLESLTALLNEYRNAPAEYQATSYWQHYEKDILNAIEHLDFNQLRSGKQSILATFGFSDVIYSYQSKSNFIERFLLKIFTLFTSKVREFQAYKLKSADIQNLAFHHCQVVGKYTNAKPIESIEVSDYGNPQDLFEIGGKKYSMSFLSYYLRYCFAQKHAPLSGNEIIIELGSGAGTQIEILKKLYPDLTILCFDLPAQIFLCEHYLTQALGEEQIVNTKKTKDWKNLDKLETGQVHFFGNWQFPILTDFKHDIFWNAASFGEMEPEIVNNYINFVKGNCEFIYLLQARHGKETSGKNHVQKAIHLDYYSELLSSYSLLQEQDAWHAHKRLSASGGYFEGVWKLSE